MHRGIYKGRQTHTKAILVFSCQFNSESTCNKPIMGTSNILHRSFLLLHYSLFFVQPAHITTVALKTYHTPQSYLAPTRAGTSADVARSCHG